MSRNGKYSVEVPKYVPSSLEAGMSPVGEHAETSTMFIVFLQGRKIFSSALGQVAHSLLYILDHFSY